MMVIKVRATRKSTSATFSARLRRFMRRVRRAPYAMLQVRRNNNASTNRRSSAQVATVFGCRISLISPMTVRHTPTIVAEVVKICTEISFSNAALALNWSAELLLLKTVPLLCDSYALLHVVSFAAGP